MHAVVRHYSGAGAKELFDVLEARKADVESAIRAVTGLVSYALIRTGDGGVSVTICEDKSGTDQSLQVAREWIQANAPDTGAAPPAVLEGSPVVHVS